MARTRRPKLKFLPQKLLQIRVRLGLSQNEMLRKLRLKNLSRTSISAYELGTGEPPLPTILEYAKVAGVCTDVLLDDKLELPDKLPAKPKHGNN